MKFANTTMACAALVVSGLLAATAVTAQTPQPAPASPDGAGSNARKGGGMGGMMMGRPMNRHMNGPMMGRMDGMIGGPGGPGRGPGGFGPGMFMPPPFLAGLQLTDEQQDKVFNVLYAAAPALRDQGKALRIAREALMKAGTAAQFDEANVRLLANAAAKAESDITVLRARTEHQIYLLLTPAQRTQAEKLRQQHDARGPDGRPPV